MGWFSLGTGNDDAHPSSAGGRATSALRVWMFIGFHVVLRPGGLISSALKCFAVTSWDSISQVLSEKYIMNCWSQ